MHRIRDPMLSVPQEPSTSNRRLDLKVLVGLIYQPNVTELRSQAGVGPSSRLTKPLR